MWPLLEKEKIPANWEPRDRLREQPARLAPASLHMWDSEHPKGKEGPAPEVLRLLLPIPALPTDVEKRLGTFPTRQSCGRRLPPRAAGIWSEHRASHSLRGGHDFS